MKAAMELMARELIALKEKEKEVAEKGHSQFHNSPYEE